MPITKRQFDLGIDEDIQSWMQKIYALLSNNRESAYSTQEIRESVVGDVYQAATLNSLDQALSALVKISAIEKRTVDSTHYYAFGWEFDTDSWVRTEF